MTVSKKSTLVKHLYGTTSLMLLGLFAMPAASNAQAAPADGAKATDDTVVVVTGTRASQRSSIERKKKAKTATDSIVSEDIGKFPDKNIGEAISRIAGVALDRGDFNEGGEVSLRGVGSNQTNVELDGLGVQNTSTTGGLQFGGDGRNKTFQEFPADLVKSVDVVKGSTAMMTEGGIGGSILIQSRTGLDFKKPYFSLRYDMTKNTLNNKWTPEFNVIASRKFMNDRLGILLNYSQSVVSNDQSAVQPQTSGSQGLARLADFDNSPNKTFTFNPSTVSTTDLAATTPVGTGNTTVIFDTPLSLVTKSAGANTKADCYALFPALTTTQLASFGTTALQNTARGVQTAELQTCLSQWNDYTPSLVRYFARRDVETRQTLDLRADYRVSDNMTVFAKFNMNKRHNNNTQMTYTLGGFGANPTNIADDFFVGTPYTDTVVGQSGTRTAIANSGYYIYNGVSAQATTNIPINGIAMNVIPDSTLVVDSTHHVTSATITHATVNTDQIRNTNEIESTYISTGGTYRGERLSVDVIAGVAKSKYTRFDYRTNLSYTYGNAQMTYVPGSGLWSYTLPAGVSQTDPSKYGVVKAPSAAINVFNGSNADPYPRPAYTIAQQPWTSPTLGLQMSPKLNLTEQKTIKIDVSYNTEDKLPFITKVYTGVNLRSDWQKGWGGGGRTVKPAVGTFGQPGYVQQVELPTQNLRGTVRACEPVYGTTGTAAPTGALSCNYGYVPNTALSTNMYGTFTIHQADFQNMVSQAFLPKDYTFFNGFPDRGDLFAGWDQLNVDKIYQMVSALSQNPAYSAGGDPLKNYNFGCIRVCTANDGKQYDMPFAQSDERNSAAYFMVEFEQKLPFDMLFNGNVGTRAVKTEVNATGYVTLNSIRCLSSLNCNSSTALAQTVTLAATVPVAISNNTTDWMPSYNYNLWVLRDKLVFRYYAGLVVSRPPISRLLPAGTCTIDERLASSLASDGSPNDIGCGTFGNPGLKPFRSRNHNWSFEYYPNRDMQFSVGLFKNEVKSGDPRTVAATNTKLLQGTDVVDPVTGQSVANQEFTYTTYENGKPYTRYGTEYAFKAALTFLPWKLKNLGIDGNYATIHSTVAQGGIRDLITGDQLPNVGEPSYYGNLSFWYDDGRTNARLSYQARDKVFIGIAPNGNANTINNYPAEGVVTRPVPYNLGSPMFTAATGYLDFKVNHKVNKNIELFFSANNLLDQTKLTNQDKYTAYSDGTPVVLEMGYPGKRITVGFRYVMQ